MKKLLLLLIRVCSQVGRQQRENVYFHCTITAVVILIRRPRKATSSVSTGCKPSLTACRSGHPITRKTYSGFVCMSMKVRLCTLVVFLFFFAFHHSYDCLSVCIVFTQIGNTVSCHHPELKKHLLVQKYYLNFANY